MFKCLNLKIYFASLILLVFIIMLMFFRAKGFLELSVAAAFLIFTVLCMTVVYGFVERFGKEILSLILSIITLFIILHYIILYSTLNVEYYGILLLRTCKNSKCSIILDWGQLFLLIIVLTYVATKIAGKLKEYKAA
ncbi:MAG: hypothetical protein B6U75_02705 [Desulfurococcales archaeon ex4484_217_1]|nr:MAG: hypothetical protein B6U75_02705 [Desulfurococcales archaeon ex4484_217_1]